MDYAEASCVLKVHVHCPACKMKMMEVLGSICGIYNVDINAEEGLVSVYGVVDPNLLLKALARTGYHAELKWAKIRHPQMPRPGYNNYYDNDYDSHNYIGYGHTGYSRALPDPYSYGGPQYSYGGPHYSNMTSVSPYYSGSNPYSYGSGMPPARSSYGFRRPRPFLY